jgi:hypothetical protein
MEIQECLICGNKRIIDIDLLKNNLKDIKILIENNNSKGSEKNGS